MHASSSILEQILNTLSSERVPSKGKHSTEAVTTFLHVAGVTLRSAMGRLVEQSTVSRNRVTLEWEGDPPPAAAVETTSGP